MLMREKVRENEVLLSGTMTLRSKALTGGRQSLYIDCFEEGRHRRESLSLYLEAESTVRSRRANAATMRRAEAILRERQSAMLSAQLSQIDEQEHRSTLLSSWLDTYDTYDTYLERRGVDDLHCIKTIKLRMQEYASMFSSLLNYAVSQGRIAVSPYNLFESEERVKPGREHKREYLTVEELKRMIDTPCRTGARRSISPLSISATKRSLHVEIANFRSSFIRLLS